MHSFFRNFVKNITSREWAEDKFRKIFDDKTFTDTEYYEANFTTPEDHGTGHVSVLDANGDAVAVTTTINLHFGAEILSPSTGYLFQQQRLLNIGFTLLLCVRNNIQ